MLDVGVVVGGGCRVSVNVVVLCWCGSGVGLWSGCM